MKRALCLLFIVTLVIGLALLPAMSASAAVSALTYKDDPYSALQILSTDLADRTVGKDSAKSAAIWLGKRLEELGYTALGSSMLQDFSFTADTSTDMFTDAEPVSMTAYNVIAYKRCGVAGARLLVIGAPFDNEKTLQMDGNALNYSETLYSASSVATLLSIAAGLTSTQLSFDVAFALWGADYFGYQGVQAFLEKNTQSLLGYIDLTFVAGGDDLNVYYDEVTRTYGKYVDSVLARNPQFANVQHKPFDPGYTTAAVGYPYGHVGLAANAYFLQQGVPSIRLFGYNWAKQCETTLSDDVMLTDDDTLTKAVETYGQQALQERMLLASQLVSTLVLADREFATALTDSTGDSVPLWLASTTAQRAFTYSMVGLVVVAIVVAAVLLQRRSKAAGTPDFSVNSNFINGDANTQDDVFASDTPEDTGSSSIIGDSKDIDHDDFDDIFGEH